MPRIPRFHLDTNYFHIITQGINKNFIFNDSADFKYYIGTMYKLKEQYSLKIISYCIMNNHTHMLVQAEDIKELSKYMQRLNLNYGIYYNKKYNRVGYVFRDRYKSEGIYSEKHLYCCIKYIYDNPVKAGLCKHAKEYPFSNYKEISYNADESFAFIDIAEDRTEIYKKVIGNFLLENGLNLNDLKKDIVKSKKLITLLKNQYNVSLRKIADEIGINREKVRQIYRS